MKKQIAIVLTLIFLFNGGGAILFLNFMRSNIKKEVAEFIEHNMLKKEEIITLSFNESETKNIRWINENEFIYDGFYYDVIDKSSNNKRINFYCYRDKKETEVNKKIDKYCKTNTNGIKTNKMAIEGLSLFLKQYFENNFLNFNTCSDSIFHLNFILPTIKRSLQVLSPPPKS